MGQEQRWLAGISCRLWNGRFAVMEKGFRELWRHRYLQFCTWMMGKSDWMSIIIVYFGVQNVQSTPALWLGRIKFPPRLVRTDSNQEYSTTADIYVGIILSREFPLSKGVHGSTKTHGIFTRFECRQDQRHSSRINGSHWWFGWRHPALVGMHFIHLVLSYSGRQCATICHCQSP